MSPRVLPDGLVARLKMMGGAYAPVALLDITTLDGSQYFWSDSAIAAPAAIIASLENLLQYSEAVQTAPWAGYARGAGSVAATATANQCVAPDGSNNGTKISIPASGSNIVLNSWAQLAAGLGTLGGRVYTFSCWLRSDVNTSVYLWLETGDYSAAGQAVINVTAAWTRFEIALAVPAASAQTSLRCLLGLANLPAGTIYAWGAQLEESPVARPYLRTTNVPDLAWAGTNYVQNYQPWLKQAGPIRRSRDSKTDAGDIAVQNLSGNTIDRDVAAALKAHEFEGAMAVLRFWDPLLDAVVDEFDGYLSEQDAGQEDVSFRILQLCDVNQFDAVDDTYAATCTLRFKSRRCGSTSANATCSKRFSDCTAVERFNGCPSPPPGSVLDPPTFYPTPIVDGSSAGSGGNPVPRPRPVNNR